MVQYSLRPRKPEGSLGRTAQDVHLDSHTAPELRVPMAGKKKSTCIVQLPRDLVWNDKSLIASPSLKDIRVSRN